MEVTLIETEGRGGVAEIELDGHRLRVVDAVSAADRPAPPGPLPRAKLDVVVIPHLTVRNPPDEARGCGLTPDHGWRYRARGEIVATQPLRADLGLLEIELEDARAREWAVGDRVGLGIDRIILTRRPG